MAKIAIKKGKKQFIDELNREVSIIKPASYYIADAAKDFHCTDGIIDKKDLKKAGIVPERVSALQIIKTAGYVIAG